MTILNASDLDLSQAAREAAADALAVFIHACRTSEDERVRLEAAKQIRDWAYGRPATQADAPQPQPEPTQTNLKAEELFDANFWASWTDTELMFHLLETVREIRALGFEASVPYYAQDAGIPL